MKVILFGATGMLGKAFCESGLRDETVDNVLVIGPTQSAKPIQS